MELARTVLKQSIIVVLPIALLSLLVDWSGERLNVLRPFGNPRYVTVSIVLGALLGFANLKGMVWSLERLLGTRQANSKLVFLGLLRLGIVFAVIIILAALQRINFLGLLVGMTIVFIILIKEGLKMAQRM